MASSVAARVMQHKIIAGLEPQRELWSRLGYANDGVQVVGVTLALVYEPRRCE